MKRRSNTQMDSTALMAVMVKHPLKVAFVARARELSRGTSKHLRRLMVDDLVKAGKMTKEEALSLS